MTFAPYQSQMSGHDRSMGLAPAAACRVQAPAIVTDDNQVESGSALSDNVLPVSTSEGFGSRIFIRTRSGTPRLLRWAGQRVERIAPRCSRFLILFPKRELTRLDLAQHVTRQSLNAAETHSSSPFVVAAFDAANQPRDGGRNLGNSNQTRAS